MGAAGTRTRGKSIAFPLIRAYAEIPLRGMIHRDICFGLITGFAVLAPADAAKWSGIDNKVAMLLLLEWAKMD